MTALPPDSRRAPLGPPVRVVVYPGLQQVNHYIRMFYQALEPYGVTVAGRFVYNDAHLREHGGGYDLIHIQWTHEELWRIRGAGPLGAARGLAGLWRFLRLARRLGKRVAWTVHDLEHLARPRRADRLGNALLARTADVVICHTEATRERLLRRYWGDPRTTVVMPHGNYDGAFPAARPRAETLARLGLDPTRPVLVGAGMVRGYKGFDLAVAAARRLAPHYQLVLAGEPYKWEPDVAAGLTAAAAGLPNVRLELGPIDDAGLADLYAAADCVLLPYRQITGSGALLTALTLGRAVVVSDLPFFRSELAGEPAAGVFVPPDDAAALADGVRAFFAADVAARHAAARRLADRVAWAEVIKPVAARLRALFPGRIAEAPR